MNYKFGHGKLVADPGFGLTGGVVGDFVNGYRKSYLLKHILDMFFLKC